MLLITRFNWHTLLYHLLHRACFHSTHFFLVTSTSAKLDELINQINFYWQIQLLISNITTTKTKLRLMYIDAECLLFTEANNINFALMFCKLLAQPNSCTIYELINWVYFKSSNFFIFDIWTNPWWYETIFYTFIITFPSVAKLRVFLSNSLFCLIEHYWYTYAQITT